MTPYAALLLPAAVIAVCAWAMVRGGTHKPTPPHPSTQRRDIDEGGQ